MIRWIISGNLSLSRKILLPFLLVLGLLGIAATLGSAVLVTHAGSRSTNERLTALQETLYREIKGHENLLLTYANLLELVEALAAPGPEGGDGNIEIVRNQLYKTLGDSNVSLAYFPAGLQKELPPLALRDLIDQSIRSSRPRFRFSADLNTIPSLVVAAPVQHKGNRQRIMVLQTPMDDLFLKRLASGDHSEAALLSMEGTLLAASRNDFSAPLLTAGEMATVLGGTPLYRESSGSEPRRYLFQAVPLGTTDMVITVAGSSVGDQRGIVRTLVFRLALTILAALLLGAYLYFRLINQIMSPTRDLLAATRAVSEGDLDYRIRQIPGDELGQLATSFNAMTSQLKALYQENSERTRQLTLAQEELRYKEVLEQKNREAEETNRELKAHLSELSALFQLNKAMISTLDIIQLFDRITEVLREVLRCDGMALLLYHPGAEELEVGKSSGIDPDMFREGTLRLDRGVIGHAARTQELLYITNLSIDYPHYDYRGKTFPNGSMVCAPMVVKKRLVGILHLHKAEIHGFAEADLKLIQAVSNQAAIAVENARLFEKTRNLSNTDELTGLANRRFFQEILTREMAQASRYSSNFTLIMADIDHFKRFNDTYGHLIGDLVLRKVAQIFLQNTRGIDLVARFGGEEFIILLPKTDRQGALAAAEKLRRCVAETNFADPPVLPGGRLTISLGLAEFPSDSKEIYDLLDRADRALYKAKDAGRNRTVAWSDLLPAVLPGHQDLTT